MTDVEWSEVTPGQAYRAEANGSTYGIERKPGGWVWSVDGPDALGAGMEGGFSDTRERAQVLAEAWMDQSAGSAK